MSELPPQQQPKCEQAIDGGARELVDHAIVAGWPAEAAFEAIKRATERQAMAYHEDPDPADDTIEVRPPTGFSLAPF